MDRIGGLVEYLGVRRFKLSQHLASFAAQGSRVASTMATMCGTVSEIQRSVTARNDLLAKTIKHFYELLFVRRFTKGLK